MSEQLDFDKDLCLYTLKPGFDEVALTLKDMPLVLVQIIIDYCAIFEPEDGGTPWPYFLDTTFNEHLMRALNSEARKVCLCTDYDRTMINLLILDRYKKIQSKHRWLISEVCLIFKEGQQAVGTFARLGVALEKFKWMPREKSMINTMQRLANDPTVSNIRPCDLVIIDGFKVKPDMASWETTKIVDNARKLIVIVPLDHPKLKRPAAEPIEIIRLDKQGVTTEYLVPEPKSGVAEAKKQWKPKTK